MRGASLVAVLLAGACAAPDEVETPISVGTSRAAIRRGTLSSDSTIFYLKVTRSDATTGTCSGVLIGQRTLATAAHCLDKAMPTDPPVAVRATNLADATMAMPSDWIDASEYLLHPASTTVEHDLALVLLSTAPATAPARWSNLDVTTFTGKPLRAAGYGITSNPGTDSGVRREVALYFSNITAFTYRLGDQIAHGICLGDSGGASFHVFPDGVERAVGVHSLTLNSDCTDGQDVRLDPNADFIEQYLVAKEGPQCAADGRCSSTCSASDPDCRARLAPCDDPAQCAGKRCVADPQHQGTYCSQPCTVPADCPTGMQCGAGSCWKAQLPIANEDEPCSQGVNVCAGGTFCTARAGEPTTCEQPCGLGCLGGRDCVPGVNGEFCAKPKVVGEAMAQEFHAARTCAVGGPEAVALLALLVLRRRIRT